MLTVLVREATNIRDTLYTNKIEQIFNFTSSLHTFLNLNQTFLILFYLYLILPFCHSSYYSALTSTNVTKYFMTDLNSTIKVLREIELPVCILSFCVESLYLLRHAIRF